MILNEKLVNYKIPVTTEYYTFRFRLDCFTIRYHLIFLKNKLYIQKEFLGPK